MKPDPRIAELHKVLDPVATIHITEAADEVSLVVDKPVDITTVDDALLKALHAEPMDRLERPDSWLIRLMKRDKARSLGLRYEAVRVIDSYYEYRAQFSSEGQ